MDATVVLERSRRAHCIEDNKSIFVCVIVDVFEWECCGCVRIDEVHGVCKLKKTVALFLSDYPSEPKQHLQVGKLLFYFAQFI